MPRSERWPAKTTFSLAAVIATAGALLVAPMLFGDYGVEIGFRLLVLFALAEAWNLLAGYTGLVSLGSAAFVGLGGYVLVGVLNHTGSNIGLALVAGACAAGLLAALVAPALFRTRGLYFTVGTLALSEALRLFMVNVPYFGGATGLFFAHDPPPFRILYYYAAAVFVIAEITLSVVTMTRLSILLRAVRDDEDAAAQIGVRAFHVKVAAFVVASVLMGAAGGVQAMRQGAIEPYGMFGLNWAVNVAFAVIIGGMGYRLGAVVGATVLTLIGEMLVNYPQLNTALTGLFLILIIRFAPSGLCGLVESLVLRASNRTRRAPPPLALTRESRGESAS